MGRVRQPRVSLVAQTVLRRPRKFATHPRPEAQRRAGGGPVVVLAFRCRVPCTEGKQMSQKERGIEIDFVVADGSLTPM